jgi:hypothetical protein
MYPKMISFLADGVGGVHVINNVVEFTEDTVTFDGVPVGFWSPVRI